MFLMWWFRLWNVIVFFRMENDLLCLVFCVNKYLGIVLFKINLFNFWINVKFMNWINFWMWFFRLSCILSMGFKGWWCMIYWVVINGVVWECELFRDLVFYRKCECGDWGVWCEGLEDCRNGMVWLLIVELKFRYFYVKKLLMKILKKYFKFVLKKYM